MKAIYRKLPSNKVKCVATIGVFDGVHFGHRFILKKLKKLAKDKNLLSLVVTFDIPPQMLLKKTSQPGLREFHGFLTDMEDKKNILASIGIDCLWFLKTNESFLKLSGKEFIEYLFRTFTPVHLLVGEDFRFGYQGKSGIAYLKKISASRGFDFTVLKKTSRHGKIISSSLIRRLVQTAAFEEVEYFLGRDYFIKGKIVKGIGLASKLGFPTANIDYDGYVIPLSGVYAAAIKVNSRYHPCAVNIAERPSAGKNTEKIMEAHIVGLKRNILGKKIKLRFLKKIREEKKFSEQENLIKAITQDVFYIKKHYAL